VLRHRQEQYGVRVGIDRLQVGRPAGWRRPYGSETLTNYEIGSKSTFLGGKVRMNNSAYYEKFKDFQFSAPVTNPDGTRGLATSNGRRQVWGLETEIAAKITRKTACSSPPPTPTPSSST
jgi:outer membrane receptor protein involved in Fe transport